MFRLTLFNYGCASVLSLSLSLAFLSLSLSLSLPLYTSFFCVAGALLFFLCVLGVRALCSYRVDAGVACALGGDGHGDGHGSGHGVACHAERVASILFLTIPAATRRRQCRLDTASGVRPAHPSPTHPPAPIQRRPAPLPAPRPRGNSLHRPARERRGSAYPAWRPFRPPTPSHRSVRPGLAPSARASAMGLAPPRPSSRRLSIPPPDPASPASSSVAVDATPHHGHAERSHQFPCVSPEHRRSLLDGLRPAPPFPAPSSRSYATLPTEPPPTLPPAAVRDGRPLRPPPRHRHVWVPVAGVCRQKAGHPSAPSPPC